MWALPANAIGFKIPPGYRKEFLLAGENNLSATIIVDDAGIHFDNGNTQSISQSQVLDWIQECIEHVRYDLDHPAHR